jgi:hypothetical protein
MDWNQQAEEMLNNWTSMQKNMWDAFFSNMNEMSKSPSEKLWDQTIAAGKQAIENTLNAQQEFQRSWVDYVKSVQGVPSQVVESAEQFQQMSKQWTETQKQLWVSWFDMVKDFDITKMSASWGATSSDPFQIWQDSTKKILDAQTDWMQAWMNAFSREQDA